MSEYDRDFQCREIISRAVCGSGKKFSQAVHRLQTPHKPSSILGAWVINHQYAAVRFHEGVEIEGSYDINIWYSYDGNTKTDVAKESVSYVEHVPLSDLDEKHLSQTAKVFAEALQHPSCVEATVDTADDRVLITIEREFQAELIAETKLCVVVCQGGCDGGDKVDDLDDDLDDYDDIDEDLFVDEDEQS
jgi:spore coat protein E